MHKLSTQDIKRLVLLTTVASDAPQSMGRVCEKLLEMAIMQQSIAGLENSYSLGDNFMQHVIFLGCSPAIELEVPDLIEGAIADATVDASEQDKLSFTFIRLRSHTGFSAAAVVPYYGERIELIQKIPRCHACRRQIKAGIEQLYAALRANPQRIQCHACQHTGETSELDWRKQTGWGNLFIEILNVYPSEAVPTDGLLQTLAEVTKSNWKFFYTQHDFQQ